MILILSPDDVKPYIGIDIGEGDKAVEYLYEGTIEIPQESIDTLKKWRQEASNNENKIVLDNVIDEISSN